MNTAITRLTLAAAAALALAGGAQAASVRSIQTFGQDGDTTYYQVQCSDKSVGSISVRQRPAEVCSTPAHRDPVCRPAWELRQAAAHACR